LELGSDVTFDVATSRRISQGDAIFHQERRKKLLRCQCRWLLVKRQNTSCSFESPTKKPDKPEERQGLPIQFSQGRHCGDWNPLERQDAGLGSHGIAWELLEGSWLRGEPIDSLEDVMLAIFSASTFLCFMTYSEYASAAREFRHPAGHSHAVLK
jgi:hypothetical protein